MIWRQWPVSGAWAIGVLFGVHMLISGWTMVILGTGARRISGAGEDAVEDAVDSARDVAEDAVEATHDVAEKAGELVEDVVDTAGEKSKGDKD